MLTSLSYRPTYKDVAGLKQQKEALYDALIAPLQQEDLYRKLVLEPSKIKERNNFLFYGPSGTGKTLLAKATAFESQLPFTMIDATVFLQKYVGSGAKSIRDLYQKSEGIVFIDEIDAIAQKRGTASPYVEDILLQLLTVLDGIGSDYSKATIMSTNRYNSLDDALLSRIPQSHQLQFPLPDEVQRKNIFRIQLQYHNNKVADLDNLVSKTNNYDGRQLEDLFAQARRNALKNKRCFLIESDFKTR